MKGGDRYYLVWELIWCQNTVKEEKIKSCGYQQGQAAWRLPKERSKPRYKERDKLWLIVLCWNGVIVYSIYSRVYKGCYNGAMYTVAGCWWKVLWCDKSIPPLFDDLIVKLFTGCGWLCACGMIPQCDTFIHVSCKQAITTGSMQ